MDRETIALRVGTWNVHEELMDDCKTPFVPWKVLERYELDVVCLQEVSIPRKEVESHPDNARVEDRVHPDLVNRYLARKSGYPHCAGMVLSPSSFHPHDRYQAIAIMSRHRFKSKIERIRFENVNYRLADGRSMHDKGALAATVEIGSNQLRVLCLHGFPLHHFNVPSNCRESRLEIAKLARVIGREARDWGDSQRLVVAGDFNFEHHAERIPALGKLSMRPVFDKRSTRPDGRCHDDVLLGTDWVCDGEIHETKSDHHLLTVSATSDNELPTTESRPCPETSSELSREPDLAGAVRGS